MSKRGRGRTAGAKFRMTSSLAVGAVEKAEVPTEDDHIKTESPDGGGCDGGSEEPSVKESSTSSVAGAKKKRRRKKRNWFRRDTKRVRKPLDDSSRAEKEETLHPNPGKKRKEQDDEEESEDLPPNKISKKGVQKTTSAGSETQEKPEKNHLIGLDDMQRIEKIKERVPKELLGTMLFLPDTEHPELRRSHRVRFLAKNPFCPPPILGYRFERNQEFIVGAKKIKKEELDFEKKYWAGFAPNHLGKKKVSRKKNKDTVKDPQRKVKALLVENERLKRELGQAKERIFSLENEK